jgi:hypothetical protein
MKAYAPTTRAMAGWRHNQAPSSGKLEISQPSRFGSWLSTLLLTWTLSFFPSEYQYYELVMSKLFVSTGQARRSFSLKDVHYMAKTQQTHQFLKKSI